MVTEAADGLPRVLAVGAPRAGTPLAFSICTLVNKPVEYERMLRSFAAHGFDDTNAEFIRVDNTKGNVLDGFAAIPKFLDQAAGRYVIVCHQDVELVDDGIDELRCVLDDLEKRDPSWALAGNAGVRGLSGWAVRVTDVHYGPNARTGALPACVDSLDENFLVFKRDAMLLPSEGLSGFFFFGLDLCLQARRRGVTAYVIDFHVRHHGRGIKGPAFVAERRRFEDFYRRRSRPRLVRSTCTVAVLGLPRVFRILRQILKLFIAKPPLTPAA